MRARTKKTKTIEPQLRTPYQRRTSSPPPQRAPHDTWQFTEPHEVLGPGQGWYVWGFVRFQICAKGPNPGEARYRCQHMALGIEDRNPTLFKPTTQNKNVPPGPDRHLKGLENGTTTGLQGEKEATP